MRLSSRAAFADVVAVADEQLDLAHAALLFAADEYRGLDIDRYLMRLDVLAAAAGERLSDEQDPHETIMRLVEFLHEEQGFAGNAEDYADPRNSYLNEVLDRKLGIPISLSLIWIELAKRSQLPIVGVGLPGHFIVKWEAPDDEILIDPFHGGRLMTVEDCRERVKAIYGSPPWRDQYLARTTNREILARMLRNLKATYVQRGDTDRALAVIQKILIVTPDSAEEVRDLGLMHLQRRELRLGMECLERYLRLTPHSLDAENVRRIIREVRGSIAKWN